MLHFSIQDWNKQSREKKPDSPEGFCPVACVHEWDCEALGLKARKVLYVYY